MRVLVECPKCGERTFVVAFDTNVGDDGTTYLVETSAAIVRKDCRCDDLTGDQECLYGLYEDAVNMALYAWAFNKQSVGA